MSRRRLIDLTLLVTVALAWGVYLLANRWSASPAVTSDAERPVPRQIQRVEAPTPVQGVVDDLGPVPSTAGAEPPADPGALAAGAHQRFAVLPADDLDEAGQLFTQLLEHQLAQPAHLAAVDRQAFDAVIEEIELAALGADGQRQPRLQAGRLLDADLLVLVTAPPGAARRVAVAVVETRYGFRLFQDVFDLGDDTDVLADAVAELVDARCRRGMQDVGGLVAVPTFVDQRTLANRGRLAEQLALVSRQTADAVPTLLTVEVEEAQLLRRELTLRGDTSLAAWQQPWFLVGEVNTDPATPDAYDLRLVLRREDRLVAEQSRQDLTAAEAAGFVRQATMDLLGAVTESPRSAIAATEDGVAALLRQADQFARAGLSERAMELIDTAVLLRPEDVALRQRLINALAEAIQEIGRGKDDGLSHEERGQRCVELYGYGIDQVRWVFEHTTFAEPPQRPKEMRLSLGRHNMTQVLKEFADPEAFYALPEAVRSMDEEHRAEASAVAPMPLEVYDIHAEFRRWLSRRVHTLASTGRLSSERARLGVQFGNDSLYLETVEDAVAWRCDIVRETAHLVEPNTAIHLFRHVSLPERLKRYAELLLEESEHGSRAAAMAMMGGFTALMESNLIRPKPWPVPQQASEPLPPRRPTKPDSETDRQRADEIKLEPIPLIVTAGEEPGREVDRIHEMQAYPSLGDLLWTEVEVLLIPREGELRSLFRLEHDEHLLLDPTRDSRLCPAVYDGRYVWTALGGAAPLVVVIDPATGKTWRFGADDNVPGMNDGVSIAPLEPGRCLITATIHGDRGRRSWSAFVTFSPSNGLAFDVFRQANSSAEADRPAGLVAESTGPSLVVTNPQDPSQRLVLVLQNSGYFTYNYHEDEYGGYKLVIDPLKRTFYQLAKNPQVDNPLFGGFRQMAQVDGQFYSTGGVSRLYRWSLWPESRVDVPWPITPNTFLAHTLWHNDRLLYLSEDAKLWATRQAGAPMAVIASNPDGRIQRGERRVEADLLHLRLNQSAVYGLVAIEQYDGVIHRVVVPDEVWQRDPAPEMPAGTVEHAGRHYALVEHAWRLRFGQWTFEKAQTLIGMYRAAFPRIENEQQLGFLQRLLKNERQQHAWINLAVSEDKQITLHDGSPAPFVPKVRGTLRPGPMVMHSDGTVSVHDPSQASAILVQWDRSTPQGSEGRDERADFLASIPGLKFIELPPGEAMLGGIDGDAAHPSDAEPHLVRIKPGIWMSDTELTVGQVRYILGTATAEEAAQNTLPARGGYGDAIRKLNLLTGETFRLPTEDEWEYACRAGSQTAYANGDRPEDLRRIGWCSYDGQIASARGPRPVKSFEPNAWGFYDMHGNVAERTTQPGRPRNPIARGGAWFDVPRHCRSASRRPVDNYWANSTGARLVLDRSDAKDDAKP